MARTFILAPLWVRRPEVLQVLLLRLPAQVEAQALAGQPANYWAVLVCFKLPKVIIIPVYVYTVRRLIFTILQLKLSISGLKIFKITRRRWYVPIDHQ
jgi:hypothetical protein